MRIAVFGGTGVTGRLLIAQALDEGDSVTAYARHPEKLAIVNDLRLADQVQLEQIAVSDRAHIKRSDTIPATIDRRRPQTAEYKSDRGTVAI